MIPAITRVRLTRSLTILLCFAVLAAGCGGSVQSNSDRAATGERSSGADDLLIVTTVAPITSIASSVIGDRARVVGVVPEGTNSHTFEPSPSVARVLADSDLVLINGLQLEEPTRLLAEANVGEGTRIIALGDATIDPSAYKFDFSFPEADGKPNPHLWTDPSLAMAYAELIRDAMIELDPDGRADYEANFDGFVADAERLDTAMRAAFATIPEADRLLLTYHDAYAYFADNYGFTVLGAIQPNDFGEPTPKEVADLIDQVRESGVPALFGSEVFPSPVLEQIGNETGVRYVDTLRDDDLPAEPGDPQHSWLGLMRSNYITMTAALGGDPTALEAFAASVPPIDGAEYPQ